jgi:hypothetical protein
MGFWDDPELKKAAEGGDFFKFDKVGDSLSGTVQSMLKKDFDGRTAVELALDGDRKVTLGQVLMLRELYVLRPEKGDQITITLANVEKKGAKTLKMFRGEIVREGSGEVVTFDQTKK